MNWKKIDESWKVYASKNGVQLSQTDDNFFYGVKTQYEIRINKDEYTLKFIGELKKSTTGYNHYWTKVSLLGSTKKILAFNTVRNKRFLYVFKSNYKNLKSQALLNLLREYKATEIIYKKGGFQLKYDFTFDNPKHFTNATNLTEKLLKIICR